MNSSRHTPKRNLTPLYCLHQAAYFFAIAAIGAFAMTYLLHQGFDAAQIGVILASTSILSCVLQPLIGNYVDKTSTAVLQKLIPFCLVTTLVSLSFIELFSPPKLITGALYIVGHLSFSITIPLCNSLCAYYSQHDYSIDYGAGSGVGSLSFSFASLVFGFIIARLGPSAMMLTALLFVAAQLLMMARYPRIQPAPPRAREDRPAESSLSIPGFCLRYRLFMLTMLGVMFLAACHSMAENFLIQLFTRIGGGSEHVGIALFLACITAAPFLLFFERIQRRINVTILLRLSGFFYIAKALLLVCAPSIVSIYLIELLQTFTYAFLYPSLYYLVLRRIRPQDMAKGQTLASAMYTLGTALGNSLGGAVIDSFGLNAMLLSAACIAFAGTILINATVSRQDALA